MYIYSWCFSIGWCTSITIALIALCKLAEKPFFLEETLGYYMKMCISQGKRGETELHRTGSVGLFYACRKRQRGGDRTALNLKSSSSYFDICCLFLLCPGANKHTVNGIALGAFQQFLWN